MSGAANGAIESFEIERKYEVGDGAALPAAAVFASIGLRLAPTERHELQARYFDTPDGALATQRLALRNRVGGKDEGWHLKAKGDDGARELLWPPSDNMPQGLHHEVQQCIGVEHFTRILTIATLHTERHTALLLDEHNVAVIELADDRVAATNELTGRKQQWREWEAELMPGADPTLLDNVEPLLIAAGAARVQGTSKIQRTMQAEQA